MLSLALIALAFPIFTGASVVGVPPSKAGLYVPNTATSPPSWKCLNDSRRVIPFSALNDDYCDCADGSDEPGTSACANGVFYCANAGHKGAIIPSSRVNDGLCEPECCDGSDERPGVCPNTCATVGEKYRKEIADQRRTQKTGSKIRSTYIAFAQKEKKRLEESVVLLVKEVVVRSKEVERLRSVLEQSESTSQASLDHKKDSPLFQQLKTHARALKSLQRAHKKLQEREKALGDILAALKDGYNPNYQDMAVLEAVRGWETLSAPPAEGSEEAKDDEEEPEGGWWKDDDLKYQLDGLLSQDYDSLLIQHDDHVAQYEDEDGSSLFDLSQYIPENLTEKYASFRETLISLLETLKIIRPGNLTPSDQAVKAREQFEAAERSLQDVIRRKQADADALQRLFAPDGFGPEGEWKKLENLCLSKDTGEYTYEVCLFGSATQKANRGGNNHLGSFSGWNPNAKPGERDYYSRQMYTKGARCYNGPERSVTLDLTCGTENAILSVEEPEKCEYRLTGTTPALCSPVVAEEETRDEL